MGYCLYGNDINDQTSPISAGLGWVTKFTKEFVGDNIIKKAKLEGTESKLIAFELLDRGIPRKDYEIKDADDNVIEQTALLYNSRSNYIKSKKEKLLVISDLEGYLVADFDDILLICKKDDAAKFKSFVNEVKALT